MSHYGTKRSSRGTGSSSHAYPTAWSDWEWNSEHQCYYRWREKARGEYEYEYDTAAQAEQESASRLPEQPTGNANPQEPRYHQQPSANILATPTPTMGSTHNYSHSATGLANQLGGMSLSTGGIYSPSGTSFSSPDAASPGYIRTRDPRQKRESFDPNYKVHKAWEFKWGRVFKVLWSEPAGNNGEGSSNATYSVRKGPRGSEQYEKVRRFVIVKQDQGHCICLPLFTYNGKGVMKNGVHPAHHAMITSDSNSTVPLDEYERGLTREPLRMASKDPRHKLDPMTRLNYAKLYTVEYNVKVWFIGHVARDSEEPLRRNYDQVHPPMSSPTAAGYLPPVGQEMFSYTQGGATYDYDGPGNIPEEPENFGQDEYPDQSERPRTDEDRP